MAATTPQHVGRVMMKQAKPPRSFLGQRCGQNRLVLRRRLGLFWHLAPLLASLSALPYLANAATTASSTRGGLEAVSLPLERGFAKVPFVSPENLHRYTVAPDEEKRQIADLCARVKKEYQRYRWGDDPCGAINWRADLKTAEGHPLLYAEFGSGPDTTLFLGGVHPDELTPIHLAFRFARYLGDEPQHYRDLGYRVVIAPLVNPDGFFRQDPQRTNGAVDVNRNFFTLDWYERADEAWREQRRGLPRYFPGYFPNTEIETLFQVKLIDSFRPDKIFSVHAPLGFFDYDGPGDQKPRHLSRVERRAKQFVHAVAKKAKNYRVVDYSFYPGSLGNFAGNERNLPTITLELETTSPAKVGEYWSQFLPGFVQSVQYPFKNQRTHVSANASYFFGSYYELGKKPSY